MYAKNKNKAVCNGLKRTLFSDKKYRNRDNDPRGNWSSDELSVGKISERGTYKIISPSGKEFWPPSGSSWRLSKERFEEYKKDNRIWFGEDGNSRPRIKRFLSEVRPSITPVTVWKDKDVGHSRDATIALKELFDGKAVFPYPKPVGLIERCLELYSKEDSIILDFFSGSATTAQAVMEFNAQNKGNRKFILVQLPEQTSQSSEAYKCGYKTICQIGEERIRRAGKKIKNETNADIDYGFRVFEIDSSNMKDVYYAPSEISQKKLSLASDNVKEDRTSEDLLIQVMLSLGIDLTSSIERFIIEDKTVYSVNNKLLACFDTDISDEVITEIAKIKPHFAVFRDSSIHEDSFLVNYKQIFNSLSPNTQLRIF